uniref:Cytochrome P450 3201A1 n=1 Tax=Chamberlinius hualienensis TaxID=1551368 RepID=A0A1J1DVP5_9MYRI|nr:cytochrome P450 3201A1 [Chamberlinius hualienensis]
MINSELLILIISTFLIVFSIRYVIRIWQLPPGPWGLPLIGYLPWIGRKPCVTFLGLKKKYGNLITVNLGGITMLVLNDWNAIKATLIDRKHHFSGRPNAYISDTITGRKDMALSDGPVCLQQRKIMVNCMRKIGLGKKSMEDSIMEPIHELIDILSNYNNKNMEMTTIFLKPTQQILWKLVSGHKLKDEDLEKFSNELDYFMKTCRPHHPVNMMPILRYIPPNGFGYKVVVNFSKSVRNYLQPIIQQHLIERNKSTDRDFIDLYLDQIEEMSKTSASCPPYDVEHLMGSLWDIFIAGTETSNTLSRWTFLYMAIFPQVQQKIQTEIDLIVGENRIPTLDDMPQLRYLQATIMEICRHSSLVPLSLPHRTIAPVEVCGFKIPAKMTVIPNIYSVNYDTNLWKNPHEFDPKRFLDKDNNIKCPPHFIPFSVGSRMCIGESVAEMEIRLILGCLLQKFNFSLPKGQPEPTLEAVVGVVYKPLPYSLHITKRFVN